MNARKVILVGGGVAGLTTAYRLLESDPESAVTVLEAGDAPGGKLVSVQVGDLSLAAGPDSFVARKPWAVDLCRELGLTLVEPGARGAFVWTTRASSRFRRPRSASPPRSTGSVVGRRCRNVDVFARSGTW